MYIYKKKYRDILVMVATCKRRAPSESMQHTELTTMEECNDAELLIGVSIPKLLRWKNAMMQSFQIKGNKIKTHYNGTMQILKSTARALQIYRMDPRRSELKFKTKLE